MKKYFSFFSPQNEQTEALKSSPLFANFSDSELSYFLKLVKTNFFRANERIISEGSYDNALYFIAAGKVRVYRTMTNGSVLELSQLGTGDFFGELTLFDNLPRSASIMTLTDTELFYLEQDSFFTFVQKYPKFLGQILKEISLRFRKSNDTYVQDILRKNQELEEAYKKLKTLDEQKSKFITLASHEIRTPLTIMMISLDLIQRGMVGNVDQKLKHTLAVSMRSAKKLSEITGKIIDVAMNNNVSTVLEKKRIELSKLIQETLENISVLLIKRNITLTLEVPTHLALEVDEEKIKQAISNILLNAIRFTPDGGTITVSAHEDVQERRIRIAIMDSGIGIPEEKKDLIFTPFYKIAGVETHHSGDVEFGSGGIGLGLTISKTFVEQHKGRILVESAVGKGSCFTVELPKN